MFIHYYDHRAIELANSIGVETSLSIPTPPLSPLFAKEYTMYCMAKSLYDLRQFRRAAHVLRDCVSDEAFFLKSYCLYLVANNQT